MIVDIKPSKVFYYIPLFILVIGSYLFYNSFMISLNAVDVDDEVIESPVHKMTPGVAYSIEVTEGEAYFIMVDTLEMENILFYSLTDSTTVQINADDTIYLMDFIVYDQTDRDNIMYLHQVDDDFFIEDYTVVFIVEFEEPGTYIIHSSSASNDLPVLPFAYLSENHEDYGWEPVTQDIDPAVAIFIITIILTLITFVPIYLKRSKAIKEVSDSPYHY